MGYGNLCQTTIMTTMYMSVGDIEDIHDKPYKFSKQMRMGR